VIAQIAAMPRLDVPNMDAMPNTNDLLGSAGITGLKTGTLLDVGSDLLFTATLPVGTSTTAQLSVVGVVLGGFSHESVDLDVQTMLASITAGFHDVPLAEAGLDVGTYSTPWGGSADMVLGESASVFTWSDTPITSSMRTTTLTTGADGEKVGDVTWTAGSNTVTVPVVLKGTIKPPTAWWRLTHPFELGK
jgi:D-alanyl-D-alanine carboxypeptidase (penicillin-binding protein 5/6)